MGHVKESVWMKWKTIITVHREMDKFCMLIIKCKQAVIKKQLVLSGQQTTQMG